MANDSVTETTSKLLRHITQNFLTGKITLSKLYQLKDKEVELVFLTGHYLFNFGKYQAALDIFSVLTLYKPTISKYWRAAGAANQALKRYAQAITAYDMALINHISDVISLTYRGEAKISLQREPEGITDLKLAVEYAHQKPHYQRWANRAKTLLSVRGVMV